MTTPLVTPPLETSPQTRPAEAVPNKVVHAPVKLLSRIFGSIVPIVLAVLGYWSVRAVDAAKSDGLGLISQLPPLYFLFVALLVVSFAFHMRRSDSPGDRLDWLVLSMHVIALIVLLHGVVSFIEQSPRFPVVYTHQGLTEYIQRTGEAIPSLDARMNWPGFFATTAVMDKIAGVDSIYPFLLWAPLFFNLTFAPLIYTIARTISTDARLPWLSLWVYYSLSWVGQDYFAPQAVNLLYFLAFMAIVLRCFRTERAALPRPIRGIGNSVSAITRRVLKVDSLQPGGAAIMATTTLQRSMLVGALALIYVASVISHQLTPFFLLLEVTMLVILRRIVLRGFPLLMTVIVFTFISYAAVGFWSGHMQDLFGGFGKFGGTVSENVGSKVKVDSSHVIVIYGRLALAAALWAAAIAGIVRRLRMGRTDIAAMVGFVAPFFVLGGQSYGGEAILRVFLFSLPFAAILAVFALLPSEKTPFTLWRLAVFTVVGVALVPAFMLTRYGNEQFEYVSKDAYIGAQQLYKLVPPESRIYTATGNSPISIEKLEQYAPVSLEKDVDKFAPNYFYDKMTETPGESYLFIDEAQISFLRLTYGVPADFGDSLTAGLLASGKFTMLYENPDARLFGLVKTEANP